ncbi:MAG: hypothetical protein GY950_28530, partial [bacterium]|nr:hypothetical protein [bacterium]
MKRKILLFLILVIGVSFVTYSASGTTKPRGHGSIVKVFGVKVGTPKQSGEVTLKIKIKPPVKPGETKPGPPVIIEKKVQILQGDTPEQKAKKISDAANEAIKGLKAEGTSLSGKNGEVTLELPAGLQPKVELRSKETGEKDKAMSSDALDDFYAELPEPTPPDDPPEEEGDSVSRPYEVIGDSTTTNTYL